MTLYLDPSIGIFKAAFDPLSLFVGVQGDWFLASDFSTLWQDTAATVPVTAVGQSVARWNSKSGSGRYVSRATVGDRPLLQQDTNGRYYVVFDGVDDELFSPAGTRTYTVGAGSFLGACFSFPAVPINSIIFGTYQDDGGVGANNYHRLAYSNTNPKGSGVVRGGPNVAAGVTASSANNSVPVDTPAVLTSVLATNGLTVDISANASRPTTAVTTFGAVNFASQCGFAMAVDRMTSAASPSNVRVYGALAAASITDQNRANAARYLGSLAGVMI